MDVALTHCTLDACRRLALPVDQLRTDRVVPISRCRRESPDALVESEREEVCGVGLRPPNTGLPRRWFRAQADAEARKNLGSRVAGVGHDGSSCMDPERPVDIRNPPGVALARRVARPGLVDSPRPEQRHPQTVLLSAPSSTARQAFGTAVAHAGSAWSATAVHPVTESASRHRVARRRRCAACERWLAGEQLRPGRAVRWRAAPRGAW